MSFDVQGDSLDVIQRRAEQVVKEFIDDSSGSVADIEIEVTPNKPVVQVENTPMPGYSFTAHVFARIRP